MDAKTATAEPGSVVMIERRFLYRDEVANVRRTHREPSPALVDSIREQGIIVPLVARPADHPATGFLVMDGGKRLRAMEILGTNPGTEVPVRIIVGDDVHARAISLTTAIIRDELHPVDRYEAFAEIVAEGATPDELKRQFAMTDRDVRQVLALGRLSPLIRKAWRDGEIDADAAKRFTLAKDHKHQEDTYRRLKKQRGHVSEWSVRDVLAPTTNNDDRRLFAFVGIDAYRAAGGDVIEDLFGDGRSDRCDVVGDPALLRKLADEKIEVERARLIEAGWAWAEYPPPPDEYMWSRLHQREGKMSKADAAERKRLTAELGKLEDDERGDADGDTSDRRQEIEDRLEAIEAAANAAAYTPEEKAKAGCFISIGWGGELRVDVGLIKGRKRGAAGKAAKDSPRSDDAPAISQALTRRLSEQLTLAAGRVVAEPGLIGLRVLLAGFRSYNVGGGVEVSFKDTLALSKQRDGDLTPMVPLAEALTGVETMTQDEVIAALCLVAGAAVNLTTFNSESGVASQPGAVALIGELPPAAFREALAEAFQAEDYFTSASATVCRAALDEMGAEYGSGWKKPALAAAAVAAAADTGWLPAELRTAHYDGPVAGAPRTAVEGGGTKKARTAAAKPAKAAPARRSKPRGAK